MIRLRPRSRALPAHASRRALGRPLLALLAATTLVASACSSGPSATPTATTAAKPTAPATSAGTTPAASSPVVTASAAPASSPSTAPAAASPSPTSGGAPGQTATVVATGTAGATATVAAAQTATPAAAGTPAPAPTTAAAPTLAPAARTSLEYGLNVFVWGHPDTRNRDLNQAARAGFGWQKSLFQWRALEPSRGQFDWSEADRVVQASNAAGLKLLARLDFQPAWARKDGRTDNGAPDDPQDFANFVTALVSRYRPGSPNGELQAIEVWNEPNLQREWGSPISRDSAKAYVDLLGAAYTAAKAANPDVTVVSAGLSPTGWNDDTARPDNTYLQWLYDAGMSGKYDALGLHGNSQAPDPLAEPGSIAGMEDGSFYFRRVEQLRAIQEANGDGDLPVWLLEFGWTADQVHDAYSWFAVTEDKKADNIITAYKYALQKWQPWIGVMMLWVLPDPSWNNDREEYWWAIANSDGSPRPALTQFAAARANGQLP